MKIKILFDPEGAYGYPKNEIIEADKLIEDYIDCQDEYMVDYIKSVDTCKAVDFIAEAWGLDYEFIQ